MSRNSRVVLCCVALLIIAGVASAFLITRAAPEKSVALQSTVQCWQAEDGDTWETFSKATGYSKQGLQKFFEGETITSGQVFDVSGFESWTRPLHNKMLGYLYLHRPPEFEPAIGGGLRNVTKVASAGVELVSRLARWPGFGKKAATVGEIIGSLNGLTQAERSMVQELVAEGKTVQIIPRSTGKTADFVIDGLVTETQHCRAQGLIP